MDSNETAECLDLHNVPARSLPAGALAGYSYHQSSIAEPTTIAELSIPWREHGPMPIVAARARQP